MWWAHIESKKYQQLKLVSAYEYKNPAKRSIALFSLQNTLSRCPAVDAWKLYYDENINEVQRTNFGWIIGILIHKT